MQARGAYWNAGSLVGGNDQLSDGVAAHAVDGARGASADRICIATRMFGSDGNSALRAARDGTFVVKGIVFAKVDDKADVLRIGGERHSGADFNAEGFVGLSVGDTRLSGGVSASAAPDIDGARRGNGTTSVGLRANACGIRRRANVIFDLLLGLLAPDKTSQEKRQDEKTTASCNKAIDFH